MKRIVNNIILFVLTLTIVCFVYLELFKISILAICALFPIFSLYGFCMGLCAKSMEKLQKYDKKLIHFGLTRNDYSKILLFSLSTLSPTYFCVLLASSIPLYTYEVWFITVFPCILVNCLPMSSVLDEYFCLTRKKLPFLIWFIILTIAFILIGIVASSVIFRS